MRGGLAMEGRPRGAASSGSDGASSARRPVAAPLLRPDGLGRLAAVDAGVQSTITLIQVLREVPHAGLPFQFAPAYSFIRESPWSQGVEIGRARWWAK